MGEQKRFRPYKFGPRQLCFPQQKQLVDMVYGGREASTMAQSVLQTCSESVQSCEDRLVRLEPLIMASLIRPMRLTTRSAQVSTQCCRRRLHWQKSCRGCRSSLKKNRLPKTELRSLVPLPSHKHILRPRRLRWDHRHRHRQQRSKLLGSSFVFQSMWGLCNRRPHNSS